MNLMSSAVWFPELAAGRASRRGPFVLNVPFVLDVPVVRADDRDAKLPRLSSSLEFSREILAVGVLGTIGW